VEPWLTVFSFSAKKWGRTSVDRVSPIKFRDDAFEKLVLPAGDKRLVMALVQHTQASDVSDIIDGKGGGCSLLFHGEPGRGKTLTAEAVAEDLRRPLYAFGVGELGTEPQGLEQKLHSVLQIAERWNAVLLLDEADVFLEARADGDVDRNAMVTTFLRLIEYYNGVLVLTTNRVRNIDKAFYSRLSLAIQFEDFTLESRQQVIRNLLSANGVALSDDEIYALGEMGVNGRQIKKAIIGARSLARSEGRPGVISNADVTELLNRLRDFGADKDAQRVEPSRKNGAAHHGADDVQ
jgi:AAA+ superfamily predicted ATPase